MIGFVNFGFWEIVGLVLLLLPLGVTVVVFWLLANRRGKSGEPTYYNPHDPSPPSS